MNPITHALASWCVGETLDGIGHRERLVIVASGVAADLDGLGMPVELLTRDSSHALLWWSEYHHVLGHNVLFAVIVTAAAALLSRSRRAAVAAASCVAFHLHLLCDLAGSRGPDGYEWPIPYFYPFASKPELSWSGQWALNAWQNIVITVALLIITFVLAWKRGYSPLTLASPRADRAFVSTLRARFGHNGAR